MPHDTCATPDSKDIQLSRGKIAIVDAEDWPLLVRLEWYCDDCGYARRNVCQSRGARVMIEFMHRLIMNAAPSEEVDHINGDKLDNRKANLRRCKSIQNSWNKKPRSDRQRSRYKGVQWMTSGRWRARITIDRHLTSLGIFDREEDAAKAYDAAARTYFGAFSRTNFPVESPN